MKITTPIDGVDLFIIYDVMDPEQVEDLYKHSVTKFANNAKHRMHFESLADMIGWTADELRQLYLSGLPSEIEAKGMQAMEELRNKTGVIMNECYPDLNLVRFNDFGDMSIRTPEHQSRMKPHVDGPPEIDRRDHTVKNLGSNYYLNDAYEGGELYYPNLNFSYKPVPNSLVIHRGTDEFKHGVNDVESGVRFSFGMFAFEHYDNELFTMGQGKDNDECKFELRI